MMCNQSSCVCLWYKILIPFLVPIVHCPLQDWQYANDKYPVVLKNSNTELWLNIQIYANEIGLFYLNELSCKSKT